MPLKYMIYLAVTFVECFTNTTKEDALFSTNQIAKILYVLLICDCFLPVTEQCILKSSLVIN